MLWITDGFKKKIMYTEKEVTILSLIQHSYLKKKKKKKKKKEKSFDFKAMM